MQREGIWFKAEWNKRGRMREGITIVPPNLDYSQKEYHSRHCKATADAREVLYQQNIAKHIRSSWPCRAKSWHTCPYSSWWPQLTRNLKPRVPQASTEPSIHRRLPKPLLRNNVSLSAVFIRETWCCSKFSIFKITRLMLMLHVCLRNLKEQWNTKKYIYSSPSCSFAYLMKVNGGHSWFSGFLQVLIHSSTI